MGVVKIKHGNADSDEDSESDFEEFVAGQQPVQSRGQDHDHHQHRDKKKDTFCKKFLRFLFSFVGLFIVLALYCVGGAFMFYASQHDIEARAYNVSQLRALDVNTSLDYLSEHFAYILLDQAGSYNNCSALTVDCFWRANISDYGDACLDTTEVCIDQNGNNVTVNSSIFCACVNTFMKNFQQDADANLKNFVSFLVDISTNDGYMLDDNGQPYWIWKWSFESALLFVMITLATIGYGNISPVNDTGRLLMIAYTILGLPIMMLFLANVGGAMANGITYIYSRVCCRWCRVRRRRDELDSVEKRDGETFRISKDVVGDEDYMPTRGMLIPITLTLVLMGLFIVVGGVIYTNWENDWSLVDSAYFCFVTLATIGFGDFVPADDPTGRSSASLVGELVFTTFYCLFGLALISMGISLMQEQVLRKLEWFGDEMGLNDGLTQKQYVLTMSYDVKQTPKGKAGNKLSYNADDDGAEDDDDEDEEGTEYTEEEVEESDNDGEGGDNDEEEYEEVEEEVSDDEEEQPNQQAGERHAVKA